MAIHPEHADAILDGRKRVEFRKRGIAEDVRTVVLYATSPVQRVVGEFDVAGVRRASPESLWLDTGDVGCVRKDFFDAYFTGADVAVGIMVGTARRYAATVRLADLDPSPAVPQSFAYLSPSTVGLPDRSPGAEVSRLGRGAREFSALVVRVLAG